MVSLFTWLLNSFLLSTGWIMWVESLRSLLNKVKSKRFVWSIIKCCYHSVLQFWNKLDKNKFFMSICLTNIKSYAVFNILGMVEECGFEKQHFIRFCASGLSTVPAGWHCSEPSQSPSSFPLPPHPSTNSKLRLSPRNSSGAKHNF